MHSITIPKKLNGYDIIAQVYKVELNGLQTSDAEVVILGHAPTRPHGKYVTAFVGVSPRMHREHRPSITEWYWGYYFDDLGAALRSFAIRSNMTLMLCTHKREVDQKCSTIGCLNYFDPTLLAPAIGTR